MSLKADHLRVHLGHRIILDDVSIRAEPGEFTVIVGPNGSGKTTLMRALTGELPYEGSITLTGQEIGGLAPDRLALRRGVLPQSTNLAFPFTVAEVIRIGCEASGARAPDLIPMALAAVGLPGFAGRFYQELSGGEQQRVQLARVLAQVWQPVGDTGPSWLFLDEPVSSLDIAHQLGIMRLAADYASRGGGVLAVMHDLNLTALFAQRVILMHQGQVVAQGAPDAVFTDRLLSYAYDCAIQVNAAPPDGIWILPQAAGL